MLTHFNMKFLFAVTLAMASIMRFYYTKILSNLFGGYKNVNNVEQFWHYMEHDLLDNMYWEYDYGIDANKLKSYNCPDGDNSIGPCSLTPEDRNILYENKLLGLPRLRQLRVRNDSCFVPVVIQEMRRNSSKPNPSECFDYYSVVGEDKRNFGLAFQKNLTTFDPDDSKATNISA